MELTVVPIVFQGHKKYGDFKWMITRPEFSDALFIYNENEESYLNRYKKEGLGNACIRPFRFTSPQRACGIPTGSVGLGYEELNEHVKAVIDKSFDEIAYVIKKYRYKRIIFSSDFEGNIGMSLFQFSDDVRDYITDRIYKLES